MDQDRDAHDATDVLSLINEGIVSIPAVPNYRYLQRQLVELNLHSNELTSLEGLGHLSALRYLDLVIKQYQCDGCKRVLEFAEFSSLELSQQ